MSDSSSESPAKTVFLRRASGQPSVSKTMHYRARAVPRRERGSVATIVADGRRVPCLPPSSEEPVAQAIPISCLLLESRALPRDGSARARSRDRLPRPPLERSPPLVARAAPHRAARKAERATYGAECDALMRAAAAFGEELEAGAVFTPRPPQWVAPRFQWAAGVKTVCAIDTVLGLEGSLWGVDTVAHAGGNGNAAAERVRKRECFVGALATLRVRRGSNLRRRRRL